MENGFLITQQGAGFLAVKLSAGQTAQFAESRMFQDESALKTELLKDRTPEVVAKILAELKENGSVKI